MPKLLVEEIIEELGLNLKVAYIDGDDLIPRMDELNQEGEQLKNIESISLEEQAVDLLTSSAKSNEEELTYEECISGNYQG